MKKIILSALLALASTGAFAKTIVNDPINQDNLQLHQTTTVKWVLNTREDVKTISNLTSTPIKVYFSVDASNKDEVIDFFNDEVLISGTKKYAHINLSFEDSMVYELAPGEKMIFIANANSQRKTFTGAYTILK